MSDTTNPITHVFDQTNGVIDGLEGESDGTAGSDTASAADRDEAVATGDRAPRADGGTAATERTPDPGADLAPGPKEDGEHVYAVDPAGDAVDEGPASGDAPADRAGDREDVTVADAYDAGPATQVGSDESTPVATDPSPIGADTEPHDTAASAGPHPLDDSIGHVFDQTNGVVEGLEGESDGTESGDDASAADRGGLNEPNPVGQQDAFRDDHYGAQDGRDRNP